MNFQMNVKGFITAYLALTVYGLPLIAILNYFEVDSDAGMLPGLGFLAYVFLSGGMAYSVFLSEKASGEVAMLDYLTKLHGVL